MEHSPPLLNTAQVAQLLGISTRTVCLWAECSELPAIKVGRQWRFRWSEVAAWLDKSPSNSIQAVVRGRRRVGSPQAVGNGDRSRFSS